MGRQGPFHAFLERGKVLIKGGEALMEVLLDVYQSFVHGSTIAKSGSNELYTFS